MKVVILISVFFTSFSLHSMNLCKTFSLYTSDDKKIEIPHKYAQQMPLVYHLTLGSTFKSIHNEQQVGLFTGALKAIEESNLSLYFLTINNNNKFICNIETLFSEEYVIEQFRKKDIIEVLDIICADQSSSSMHSLFSVTRELEAFGCAVIFISHCIKKEDHSRLFAKSVTLKERENFENHLDKYIVQTSAKKCLRNKDIQDEYLKAMEKCAHISPCRKKILQYKQENGKLFICSTENGTFLSSITTPCTRVIEAVFSRDGTKIGAIGGNAKDYLLLMYNVSDGSLCFQYALSFYPNHLALNDNGSCVAVTMLGDNNTILAIQKEEKKQSIYVRSSYKPEEYLYIRENNKIVFREGMPHGNGHCLWDLNKGKDVLDKLSFAEKLVLYSVYDGVCKKTHPLVSGITWNYIAAALPEVLRWWMRDQKIYFSDNNCTIL